MSSRARWPQFLALAVSLPFFALVLVTADWDSVPIGMEIGVALVLAVVAQLCRSYFWILLASAVATSEVDRDARLHLLRAVNRSRPAQYIPGRIAAIGSRYLLTVSAGYPRGSAALIVVYEILLIQGYGLTLGLSFLVAAYVSIPFGLVVLALTTAGWVAAIGYLHRTHATLLLPLLRRLRRRQLAEQLEQSTASEAWSPALLLASLGYLSVPALMSAATVFVASSIEDLDAHAVSIVIGASALAQVAGWVAVFTPQGLGVREGVLGGLVVQLFDTATAAALAGLARIVNTLAELLAFGAIELFMLLAVRSARPHEAAEGRAVPSAGAAQLRHVDHDDGDRD